MKETVIPSWLVKSHSAIVYWAVSPVGIRGDAEMLWVPYSWADMSGDPSGTRGTPVLVPRLIAGLLEVRRKSFVDLLTKAGLMRSKLLEKVAPGTLDVLFTNVSERLWVMDMLDPLSPQAVIIPVCASLETLFLMNAPVIVDDNRICPAGFPVGLFPESVL